MLRTLPQTELSREIPDLDSEPLAPARGVLLGVGIGVALWAILGLFIVLAVRLAGGM